jgi:UDP-N-acetylmuramate dehydrogenase
MLTTRKSVPLAPYTTLGLGGPAEELVTCTSIAGLTEAIQYADGKQIPVRVLGGGSNIIVSDEGVRGLVMHMAMRGFTMTRSGDEVLVRAGAGEPWEEFVARCIAEGLGGIECLSGIPGQVGATPIQNVGAYGQEVARVIERVNVLDRTSCTEKEIPGNECGFRYRQSRFKSEDVGRYIVTAVTFRLKRGASPVIRYPELEKHIRESIGGVSLPAGQAGLELVRNAVITLRRRKSMVVDPADPNSRSVGSFFMNPVLTRTAWKDVQDRWTSGPIPMFPAGEEIKVPAAWLVEHAGFPRGTRRGGVGVSANHALALVNLGGTTRELLALAAEIEHAVLERFGVRLEREPVLFG